jgi:hypothetical protein
MPAHWTYDTFEPTADLAQGDIIEPTPDVRVVLKEVHPHFLDTKYVSFMVLSQSCDLVRRSGYRSQPINLCVVRELSSVAARLLELFCGSGISGIFRLENLNDARRFLERVVNQNEQAVGLFYLHPDADSGISVASIAMLRIAIALRTDHYDKLVAARRGRLRPEFQAKLGWLIGNLYSRVGTEDWSEPDNRRAEQDQIIKGILDNLTHVEWGSSQALRKAKNANFSVEGKSRDEILTALKAFEPEPLDELVQKGFQRIAGSEDLGIDPQILQKLIKRIRNDSEMSQYFQRMKKR